MAISKPPDKLEAHLIKISLLTLPHNLDKQEIRPINNVLKVYKKEQFDTNLSKESIRFEKYQIKAKHLGSNVLLIPG